MRRPRRQSVSAAALLLCCAVSTDCQEGGIKILPGETTLSGEWRTTSASYSSTCEPVAPVGATPSVGAFRIEQSGDSLVLILEGCCADHPLGTGMINGDAVNFQIERSVNRDPACTLLIDETISGVVLEDRITGQATLGISASGECGPGFPCETHGNFTLERCARSCRPICAQVICEP